MDARARYVDKPISRCTNAEHLDHDPRHDPLSSNEGTRLLPEIHGHHDVSLSRGDRVESHRLLLGDLAVRVGD